MTNRIWIACRKDGAREWEYVIRQEAAVAAFKSSGYTITEYISADAVSGLIHAASTTGQIAGTGA
jgi:antirestriction protein